MIAIPEIGISGGNGGNADDFAGFYHEKRVLVTGHTGFKGGWLSLWLNRLGAMVTGFALPPESDPNFFEIGRVERRVQNLTGDIRNRIEVRDAMVSAEPEVIFHLAAQPLVRRSYIDPVRTFETNVIGTINLFEAIRSIGFEGSVVVITSDKCYDNREWVWGYRETDALGGHDPYSASKACAEIVTASYRQSYFSQQDSRVRIATARAGNVIGGGDFSEDRLICDAVRSFSVGQDVRIRSPHSVRPWQHVLEPLSGYLWLGALLGSSGFSYEGAWNFGPATTDAITVEALLGKLQALWGRNAGFQIDAGSTLLEAQHLQLDCSKAFRDLGWHSVLDVDEALKLTVDWYTEFYYGNGDAMAHKCDRQIALYTLKARENALAWACSSDRTANTTLNQLS